MFAFAPFAPSHKMDMVMLKQSDDSSCHNKSSPLVALAISSFKGFNQES
jgi:hypothetical protein